MTSTQLLETLESAPVDSDASAFRDTSYAVSHHTTPGLTCPRCRTGEVWQPGQTLDTPMIFRCLRCGLSDPAATFTVGCGDV